MENSSTISNEDDLHMGPVRSRVYKVFTEGILKDEPVKENIHKKGENITFLYSHWGGGYNNTFIVFMSSHVYLTVAKSVL